MVHKYKRYELALKLNEFEGHRLEQEFDDEYWDEQDRLKALRAQLVTLFFTAIILQNSTELIVPKFVAKIREIFRT